MQQVTDTISITRRSVEDRLDLGTIAEANRDAGRIGRPLVQQIAGQEARVGGEDSLQIVDVAKWTTVGKPARGVDRAGERVAKVVSGLINSSDDLSLLQPAIAGAPRTQDIEVLKSQTVGIELRVAAGTTGRSCVQGKHFADRPCSANIGFHRRDAGRGRRRGLTQQPARY